MKAYLADARLKLSKFADVEEIVSLQVDPNVIRDMRNVALDEPITTAVWAKHNAKKCLPLVRKLNESKRYTFKTRTLSFARP